MFNNLKTNQYSLIKILLLFLVVVFAFWTSAVVKDIDFVNDLVRKFGYGGIFIIAVVSGFNLVVPIPAVSFLPVFIASGLNILAIIAVIATGMTLADFIGYLLGKAGRHMTLSAIETKVINKFEKAKEKLNWSPSLALFLFASFAPFPNEIIVVPMAFLGYRFKYIFMPLFFGNLIFNSVYVIGAVNILKFIN